MLKGWVVAMDLAVAAVTSVAAVTLATVIALAVTGVAVVARVGAGVDATVERTEALVVKTELIISTVL